MEKHHILVLGAGKIGQTIAHILAQAKEYHIWLADIDIEHAKKSAKKNLELISLNIRERQKVEEWAKAQGITACVSALPYQLTTEAAKLASLLKVHYFDLTEDIHSSEEITQLASMSDQAFVPHCGLAPGLINIIANDLMGRFSKVEDVKLRCGALPKNTSNALHYSLTWSTDGLINEYGNPCNSILDGKLVQVSPLENLENIHIDGLDYEAFNTSGGIGTLTRQYLGRVQNMDYKSVRYPGHCEKMRFLMNGLKLNSDRPTLKKILENAIAVTEDDVVIIYVSVTGEKDQEFMRDSFVKKYYPARLAERNCTAIQATTASSASAVIDTVLQNSKDYRGFVPQEVFTLEKVLKNRFGGYLKT
jgi:saccharopine dehydrogenase-like NADP-dependent oxidoreductase